MGQRRTVDYDWFSTNRKADKCSRDSSTNRTTSGGDCVNYYDSKLMGQAGLYTELGVQLSGEVPKPLSDLWNSMVELQDLTAEYLKPGAKPVEIIEVYNRLIA